MLNQLKLISLILFYNIIFFGCGLADKELESNDNLHHRRGYQIKVPYYKIVKKATEAKTYIAANEMNSDYFILIDMSIHSGLERLFVWDNKADSAILKALVSHGCCQLPWGQDYSKDNPQFSNQEGSHCSSLGKYKIGSRGYSQWGINVKYLLHGLEESNNVSSI